jgi:hypothetical protein
MLSKWRKTLILPLVKIGVFCYNYLIALIKLYQKAMDKKTKIKNKKQIQKKLGMKVDEKSPLVLVCDMSDRIHDVLKNVVDGVPSIGVQLLVVEPTRADLKEFWCEMEVQYPGYVKIVPDKDHLEDAVDLELLEDVTVEQLKALKDKYVVPLAQHGVVAYDPVGECGSGFTFNFDEGWSLFVALVRASETYRFPYDWGNIIKG